MKKKYQSFKSKEDTKNHLLNSRIVVNPLNRLTDSERMNEVQTTLSEPLTNYITSRGDLISRCFSHTRYYSNDFGDSWIRPSVKQIQKVDERQL